jgi:hypothetical protein
MPEPSYTLSPNEKARFLSIIEKLKTFTNYVSALYKRVGNGKLRYMKSYDFMYSCNRYAKGNK